MAKLNVNQTAHGNVKIVLDPSSANKLWTILGHSHLIARNEQGATAQNKVCESFSNQLCSALQQAGLVWKDPRENV